MRARGVAIGTMAVAAVVAVGGCASSSNAPTPSATASTQNLPLIANIKSGDQVVFLEVARTPQEQDTGLMFRTDLPADRGMLFVFDPERVVSLWMKNTLIPLDIVFLRDGIVTKVDANVPTCTADPCVSYSSEAPVDQVIELKAGLAAELGIKPGDPLEVNAP